jgi:Flp pilus assembly protein TadG
MRRWSRGQATVEFAFLAPVVVLVMLGAIDLSRGFYQDIQITGAARSGVRSGVASSSSDIGDAIRSEPNSGIPNTQAVWGSMASGQPNGCTPNVSGTCGDPNGCPSSYSGKIACFAVRSCTLSGGDTGTPTVCGNWGTRPGVGNTDHGLQIVVVYRLVPVTPLLGDLTRATGGFLYVRTVLLGDALYV